MSSDTQPLPPFVTAKGRDLRMDLLRGYFVFAMIVDHVRGASPVWLLTGGNRFFTGAAEGFIFISGLVAGLVYARLIARDGMGKSFIKVLSRAVTLYLLTLALTLVFMPVSELLNLPWAEGINTSNPITILVSIITLHRTYHLVDVMLLYTLLFMLTPIALVMLDQGKRWWLLGISWALWGLFQIWPDYANMPWAIASNYVFNFSAWQVLFITGLVLGYGRKYMPVPKPRTARIWLLVTGAILALLIVLFFVVEPPLMATPDQLASTSNAGRGLRVAVEDFFLNKVYERPGRLFASGITFTFLFLLVTVAWKQVERAVGWLFLPLGQSSLYAYTVHVGLVAVVAIALAPLNLENPGPQWLNALIQLGSVAVVWGMVRFKVLSPTPRSQKFYNAMPAVLAICAGLALYLDPTPNYPGLTEPALTATATRAVSRFGTPLPPDTGKPTLVPTPMNTPRPGEVIVIPTPTPQLPPMPTPEAKPNSPSEALARVEPYLRGVVLNGTLEEDWFYSASFDREMPYWVYLPPDYDAAGRRYPVLYLLHGRGGHRDEWIAYGVVEVADREMSHGVMAPFIIIMPQGDQSYWLNSVDNGPRWGDYVSRDLVIHVDATYHTLRAPQFRAIGGLSMGGFGALTLAFTHRDVFGVVGAHAPSLRTEGPDIAFLGTGEQFALRDPVSLAETVSSLRGLRVWIDVDADDPWLVRAEQLHETLSTRGVYHVWQVSPGTHGFDYWSTHIIDYLHFYGDALVRR